MRRLSSQYLSAVLDARQIHEVQLLQQTITLQNRELTRLYKRVAELVQYISRTVVVAYVTGAAMLTHVRELLDDAGFRIGNAAVHGRVKVRLPP